MFKLVSDTLSIELTPIQFNIEGAGGAYLEWLEVDVAISDEGFSLTGEWMVMPIELQEFHRQIATILAKRTPGLDAQLICAEKNFQLSLKSVELEYFVGEWFFQTNGSGEVRASGKLGLDSFSLNEVLRGIERLLAAAKKCVPAN